MAAFGLLPQLTHQRGPDSRLAWLLQLIIAGHGLSLAADRRTVGDAAASVAIFHFLEKIRTKVIRTINTSTLNLYITQYIIYQVPGKHARDTVV